MERKITSCVDAAMLLGQYTHRMYVSLLAAQLSSAQLGSTSSPLLSSPLHFIGVSCC